MKILSWNVAGLRGSIKKKALDFLKIDNIDIICFQETKTLKKEIKIPKELENLYPYRFWGENHGITQRKGLSGTSIWSKKKPINIIDTPDFDKEGRITSIEFKKFILITVYTPNSQDKLSERCMFRTKIWDQDFREFVNNLNKIKPTIICGDFNVAHKDKDIYDANKFRDIAAGFLNSERNNFNKLLDQGFIDIFRYINPDSNKFSYWDQIRPHMRKNNKGWRIDYFLIPNNTSTMIKNCDILDSIMGSDHAPLILEFNKMPPKKVKLVIKDNN